MTPTEDPPDSSGPYSEAIGQLLAAAERTRDTEAWFTLTALAEMFVRLDQQHKAIGAEQPPELDGLQLDRLRPAPEADETG